MAFQINIADDGAFKREILETPGIVQVVECYKEWCGPCKAIVSTFRRMCLDLGDSPLKFYTANVDQIEALEDYRASCKPEFLIYKDGRMTSRISGVRPEVSKQILLCLSG